MSFDFFICELTPIGKISQTMLQKVIIHIKKADYSMTKQVLFLSESMQSEDVNGKVVYSIPRIEIVFNPRKKNEVADNLLVTKENYFTEKSNKIILSKRLARYQLF